MPGVALAALFLGDLTVGASSASRSLGIPSQLGAVVQGVLLLTTVALLALRRIGSPRRAPRRAADIAGGPWTSARRGANRDDVPRRPAGRHPAQRHAARLRHGRRDVPERSGVLNLGIEGTMYAGAFAGFAVAWATGSPLLGLAAAIVVGLAGAVMALLTVTLGANQHVSGIGLTIALIGLSEFTNRLMFAGGASSSDRADADSTLRGAWARSAPSSTSTG